tara:strand:- start:931 stop:1341 length:411 start_codon:yes stop_codon:yes gene_type:complete
MSRKLKRQFKKLDRMLDKWGFDMDDPIIGKNKISAEVEYEGIDFEITLEKDGKSWKKDLSSLKLEVDVYKTEFEILWEFDNIRKADKSLLKDMRDGTYDRALGSLNDQNFSKFNDYIEGLNGFSNSDITLNGDTFF